MNPRRLVLCLDGTWNNAYRAKTRSDGHSVLKPTNVLKLARAILPHDPATDRAQIVAYDVGVGSLTRYAGSANRLLSVTDKLLGGGWGAGFEGNVERALTFLVLNHEPGDEVFLFGFSRGAATAQAVTRFLDWAGGLPVKHDAYYLPRLFREYLSSRGTLPRGEAIERINEQRAAERRPLPPLDPFQPVRVELLGVWDTVMAPGSRFKGSGAHTSGASRSFHVGVHPAACVHHARQALAMDEVRFDFRPEIWTAPARPDQTLKQRWFAGVHSNVGGGYVNDGLANIAFRWMLLEATELRLAYDRAYARKYRGYPQDRLYRADSVITGSLEAVRGRLGRGRRPLTGHPESAGMTIDRSVFTRMKSDPRRARNATRCAGASEPDPLQATEPDRGPRRPDQPRRLSDRTGTHTRRRARRCAPAHYKLAPQPPHPALAR